MLDIVLEIADDVDATPAQVALTWHLHHPDVTAPIVGASSVEQLDENLGASDVSLTDEQFERLQASKTASLMWGSTDDGHPGESLSKLRLTLTRSDRRTARMIVLSKPAEPTPEVVKRFADATDREAGEVRTREGTAEEAAVKQGVIGYLSEHWSSYDIPEPRVERACGTADAPIETWLDGEDAWDDVLERVQRSLDRQLTDRVRIENV